MKTTRIISWCGPSAPCNRKPARFYWQSWRTVWAGIGPARVASRIAVESVAASVRTCENLNQPESLLNKAFITANQEIVDQSQNDESQKGMGTTCVSALIIDRKLYLANIGDSRLYLVRDRQIRQLTFDHTWMEELSQARSLGKYENFTRASAGACAQPLPGIDRAYPGGPAHPHG